MAQLSLSGTGNAFPKKNRISVNPRVRGAEYGDEESFRVGIQDQVANYETYPPPSRQQVGVGGTINPLTTAHNSTINELAANDDVVGKVLRATEEREKAAYENYRVAGSGKRRGQMTNYIQNDKMLLSGFVSKLESVVSNISVTQCSAEDLLELKSAVFDVKSAYDQVDLARRFVLLKKMIAEMREEQDGSMSFNGKTIMDMIELCEHILEAMGECEPADPQAGKCLEIPKTITCGAPMLLLYRCIPQFIRQIFLKSGWSTIVTLNEDSLADADMGINAMGIINALIMTVPFGLLSGSSAGYWDELRAAIFTCAYQHGLGEDMIDPITGLPTAKNPNGWYNPATRKFLPITDYGWSYDGIRREFLAYISLCIFSALNCVLLSTIYYVFHRGGEKDPRILHGWWKHKGYLIVVVCGILTITSVSGLFALTKNMYVYYSVNLANVQPILDSWWGRPSNTSQIITKNNHVNFINPGAIPTGPVFVSDVCNVNSLEFATPAVISVIGVLLLGLFFVF